MAFAWADALIPDPGGSMFASRLLSFCPVWLTAGLLSLAHAVPAGATCVGSVPSNQLVAAGHLSMSTNPTLPPLQYVDAEGKLMGMNVELGESIGQRLCLQVDFVRMDFPAMIPALKAARIDGINTGMFWTEERSKMMYTVPYAISTLDVVVSPQHPLAVADVKALRGHAVGVESDSYQERWLRDRAKEATDEKGAAIEVHAYTTASDVIAALRAGQIDMAVLPSYTAVDIVNRKQAVMALTGQGATQTTLAFRTRAVAEAVAGALDAMRADGSYAKLLTRFGMTPLPDAKITVRGPGPV
ncbi:transporter substrate-binding domain-containing protein [Paraburkholderia sp. Cy-641]|nr:transporter substrate-binding domain-containing protein [Paraburkholderia sp. Cy-641]